MTRARAAHRPRRAVLVLTLAISAGCASTPTAPPAPASGPLADLMWLSGRWIQASGEGQTAEVVEETWTRPRGDQLLGTSHTVRAGRTVFFEFLRIESGPDGVRYVAQPKGGPATAFARIASGPTSITFSNPAHDHPTHIRYRREGTTLIAEIWGRDGDRRATWRYRRVP